VRSARPELQVQRRLHRIGKALFALLLIWDTTIVFQSARTQLLAHATFTGPLGSEPTWTDENNPGMKVNQIVDIELPTAQRVHACFKGNIPPGGYSLAGAYSEAYPPAENFRK
jgi:hypothetical protein